MRRPELWVPALDGRRPVLNGALLYRGADRDRLRLYCEGEPAGELVVRSGLGAALLQRMGLVNEG
jgi:hypothetical protein